MRQWKTRILTLLLGCLIALTNVQPVLAATGGNDENYTYTVTLYSGKQGTFSSTAGIQVDNHTTGSAYQILQPSGDKDTIYITGLQYGDVVVMNAHSCVNLGAESKYYIGGVRQSGRDNNTVSESAFKVTSDRDYVVAYGIKGNMVSYTVNYVDEEGNALLDSDTYYGSVGDRPVVAFRYVEGYIPMTYNLTKTLSADASQNVFTFVYRSLTVDELENVTVVTPDEDLEDLDEIDENDNADEDENANGGDEPVDLTNLDEEEVPLATRIFEQVKEFVEENMLASVGISIFLLLGLCLLLLLFFKKRKKKKDKNETETKSESEKKKE